MPERFDTGVPTPCAYIRLIQPLHHPSITENFDIRLTDANAIFDHHADIIVTQRSAMPDLKAVDNLSSHSSRMAAHLLYDLDDDLLDIPRAHPDAALLRPRARIVRRLLDVADTVWLSTPGLADRLGAIRPDAAVMPNALDERIWIPPAPALRDQPVRILCMGTTTHDRDLALIEPALIRIKNEYADRVAIDVIGMTTRANLPQGITRLTPPPNALRAYPGFVHWLNAAQHPWHIGLAPLLDTAFNRSKSAVKAMDYAAMGLVVLASDTTPYQGSIADGPAGRLVQNNTAAWYAALNWLVRNQDARQAIADRSRAAFLASASLASQAGMRQAALSRLRQPPHPSDAPSQSARSERSGNAAA